MIDGTFVTVHAYYANITSCVCCFFFFFFFSFVQHEWNEFTHESNRWWWEIYRKMFEVCNQNGCRSSRNSVQQFEIALKVKNMPDKKSVPISLCLRVSVWLCVYVPKDITILWIWMYASHTHIFIRLIILFTICMNDVLQQPAKIQWWYCCWLLLMMWNLFGR